MREKFKETPGQNGDKELCFKALTSAVSLQRAAIDETNSGASIQVSQCVRTHQE